MNLLSILTSLRSIRTKFGLVTAFILFGLLLTFYAGGRLILVHMIREAERDIQVIGTDIKLIVNDELSGLRQAVRVAAQTVARSGGEPTHDALQLLLCPFSGKTPVNLAFALGSDGSFKRGCFLIPGEPLSLIERDDVRSYLDSLPSLLRTAEDRQSLSGVITFREKPFFIALSPVKDGEGAVSGFVLLGSLMHSPLLVGKINQATRGMQVSFSDRRVRHTVSAETNDVRRSGIAPVFQEALNYYSGGRWHVGENAFEAVMPVQDILGQEVTSIAIRLPRTFSSIASIALGWLTAFVATVGIVFVLPIFWLQTRILLNPLSKLAEQIRDVGEHHLDGNCSILDWPQKDEFGLLARSVNNMIGTLSQKSQQIRQSEQRQSALIAGMPDGLCVFDNAARLIAVHKQPDRANPIPGLNLGHTLAPPVFPEADCEAMRQAILEAFRSEAIQVAILSCRETESTFRHFETRISRMDVHFALVVMRDVTKEWHEREIREQVEDRLAKVKKMESLGNLAAGIAHDFNNILAIIQNTAELTWLHAEAETREALSTIRQATGKGIALTRELMTYAGQTRIAFKHDDPNTLILDLEKLMGGVVASNVALELKLAPDLPYVDVDPQQFWKVIINLLKNASESMNGSRGQIRISTYPHELTRANIAQFFSTHELTPAHGVVFQIDDTGAGISREVIGRIFEPFFSTKAVGRGLGLSTVFGIVDAHSGGIALDSEVGKGTRFRIWLPASKEAAPAKPEPASAADAPPSPACDSQLSLSGPPESKSCVLLVEDDPAILHTTTILLRAMNVKTLQAATKREALMCFRKHADSISLILMDSQLGHLDNVRLLATLRMRKPGIPIVIVSGHTEGRIREMFASEPFDGFLSKPYTMGELAALLDRLAHIGRTS
jgi:signal transduction histidine kinase/CheY-like chemotaxis protein